MNQETSEDKQRGSVGKLVTPEPVEKTPIRILYDILAEVDAEARKKPRRGAECLPRYWQGKKDGIRIAMIVLGAIEGKELDNVRSWQTSSGVSRYTSEEVEELYRRKP